MKWDVFYTDGHVDTIEADQVSVGGSVLMFVKVSNLQLVDGKASGMPVAFVDISNAGVRCVRQHVEAIANV